MRTIRMPLEIHAVVVFGFLSVTHTNGQWSIGDQKRVDMGPRVWPVNETAITCSELNPMLVVAAWYENLAVQAAVSSDGGVTWAEKPIVGLEPNLLEYADPMACADPRTGTIWIGGYWHRRLLPPPDLGESGIWIARWNAVLDRFDATTAVVASPPDTSADKPFMAAGRRPDLPNSTRMYIAYQMMVGGVSGDHLSYADYDNASGTFGPWTTKHLPRPSAYTGCTNPDVDGPLPRVGPQGQVYVIFADQCLGVWLHRYTGIGANLPDFGTPIQVAKRLDIWSYGEYLPAQFPGVFRVPARAYMAVDPRPDNGTLYCLYFDTTKALCPDPPPPNPPFCTEFDVDIYLTKSTAQGDPGSWTVPTVINVADSFPYDQFFPWIEVDSLGRLHVDFYDTLGAAHSDFDNDAYLRTRYARSIDGGQTWTESTIAPKYTNASSTWLNPYSFSFIGDYIGLAATSTRVYPCHMATIGPENPVTPNQDIYTNVIIWPGP